MARHAAEQNWPPFVLVAGLLLVGLVADDDGLFEAAGRLLARRFRNPVALFAGAAAMVGLVTATLNLDTSVAFMTPVLVYTARSRGSGEPALLYGSLLLANAGSLFLPGSNLTNLIVLGNLDLTGGQFLRHMWAPAVVALAATAVVIGVRERRSLQITGPAATHADRMLRYDVGLAAIVLSTVAVLVLSEPALPVLGIGAVAAGIRLAQRRTTVGEVRATLGLPVLVGLFALTVALGTLARAWSGPSRLLAHLDSWGTAAFAAVSTVFVNNLPAAALLGARTPPEPFALLIGLNLGPNLFVSGSLAWILWLRAARKAGARPSIRRASALGLLAVPLSMAAALAVLALL
jgi:arsenical pump membrane protein